VKTISRLLALIALAFTITACGGGPGSLEGTWQMSGAMPMTITFRSGETEALGMIEKVSYKTDGNDVLVTYLDGMAKGTTIRYTITSKDSASTGLGTLRRLR
jgi:hypothetical protein